MKNFIKPFVFFLFSIFFFILATKVSASEGLFRLKSTVNQTTRCFVASLLLPSKSYQVTFSCRDLIYPAEGEISSYILWATPLGGGKEIKLGSLGTGRGSFTTKKPFSQLFVTIEKNKQTTRPQGQVVLRGSLETIDFLENSPTPTPKGTQEKVAEEEDKVEEKKPLTTREKLVTGLKRAGVIAFFALIVLVGLIFVITRARG